MKSIKIGLLNCYMSLLKELVFIDNNYLNQFFYKLRNDIYLLKKAKNFAQYKRIQNIILNPIIIGGCARSGTTLLLSILSSHQNIHSIPYETCFFTDYRKSYKKLKIKKFYNYVFDHKLYDYSLRICEKTPRNILVVDQLLNYFGNRLRFINIVRDGRDVVTSIHPKNPYIFWVNTDRWVDSLNEGRLYENHPQVLTIRYEDLILDFKATMLNICEFIDEEYSTNFENYDQFSNVREIHGKKTSLPYKDSIGRWKSENYKELIYEFMKNPKALELLKHYKYID